MVRRTGETMFSSVRPQRRRRPARGVVVNLAGAITLLGGILVVLAFASGALGCSRRAVGSSVRGSRLPVAIAETCAVRLAPRASGAPDPEAVSSPRERAPPAPRSTIVVDFEIPIDGLRQSLEAKVPRRVADERNHDLGPAGRLEYTVDRGPFTVVVEGDALRVESTLHGRAQACAKGRCYAGCAPEARATARVPLRLSADYKIVSSEVRIDVTRGCEVRALGGLLAVDVTPILRGALAARSRAIQASIDRELPDLRPEAMRLWEELERPMMLPLGACVVLSPEEVTQGRAGDAPSLARMRFGVLARPELRVKCAATDGPSTRQARPLPRVRDDPALPPVGDVHLAIVLPADAATRALEAGDPIDVGRGRVRVRRAAGGASSGFQLELSGEACGDVIMSASSVAWRDPQSLHLTGVAPAPGETERLVAAGLDGARLAHGVEQAAVPLPISLDAFALLIPELARGLSDARATVAVSVEGAKPESARFRGNEIEALALVRGTVTIRGVK